MEVRIYKEDMKKLVSFPDITNHFENFITKVMWLDLLSEEEDYFVVNVNDDTLIKQTFNNVIWYQSRNKKYGLFQKEDYWKLTFQRK